MAQRRSCCHNHSPSDIVKKKVQNICRGDGCTKQASYGPLGNRQQLYCNTHRPLDHVYKRGARCPCGKQPHYGLVGTNRLTHCASCRPNSIEYMYLYKPLCEQQQQCDGYAKYGVEGGRATACKRHATSDMVLEPAVRCQDTKYQQKIRGRLKTERRSAEKRIQTLLSSEFPDLNFVFNCKVGAHYPDCLAVLTAAVISGCWLIVEIDEHQHKRGSSSQYSPEREDQRLRDIYVALLNSSSSIFLSEAPPLLPKMLVLRFNPDTYKPHGGQQQVPSELREQHLVDTIRAAVTLDGGSANNIFSGNSSISSGAGDLIFIEHLFYDGYDYTQRQR